MAKVIALQSLNQELIGILQEEGYEVIDMYEAHHQRELVDAYLYTTYHPDAFTAYHSLAQASDIILEDTTETTLASSSIMLNISNLSPEQIVQTLARRL